MSSHWTTPFRVPCPIDRVFTARIGAAIFFCGYSRWQNKYFLLWGGGHQEEVETPDLWLCDSEYAKTHQRNLDQFEPRKERVSLRKSNRPQQLSLF